MSEIGCNGQKSVIYSLTDLISLIWIILLQVNEKKLVGRKIPLELKTGRSSFSAEHKGQLTLYSMMMSRNEKDFQSQASPGGLLLYLKDNAIQHVPAGVQEKQALIQLRNEMVRYLTAPTTRASDGSVKEAALPPRIDRVQACANCPYITECTIYQVMIRIIIFYFKFSFFFNKKFHLCTLR